MISEKTFTILGHEKAEAILARAIASDKVFPTWIFCGPFGVGKSTLAYKFAKCLLSGAIPTGDSLDIESDDKVHKLVDLKIHPDFFVMEKLEESVSIDDTRELMIKIKKTPALSRWRVIILENASHFNRNIYNSLLKILEEPPKNTVIILIANKIGYMPKTLLSRAAKINFNPIEKTLVKQILEDMNITNAERLAQLSNGSIGYAMELYRNNGVEIYNNILQGFSANGTSYKKTMRYIIENNLCNNFEIAKESILRILKIYTDMLSGVSDEQSSVEKEILNPIAILKNTCVDYEIKKILEIISMINKCEPMMLDKNAVVMNVFEKFFSEERYCES